MRVRRSTKYLIILTALVLAGLGVLMICAATRATATMRRVLWWLCCLSVWTLTFLLLRFVWLSRDTEPNFFLYDRTMHKNIQPEQLTFQLVNEKMTLYFALHFEPESRLWLGDDWERSEKFGTRGEYRGITAYKMLYNLITLDDPERWRWFTLAECRTVGHLCDALARAGERDLAQKIHYLKNNGKGDAVALRSILLGNRGYFEKRMLRYVRQNLEWFYDV